MIERVSLTLSLLLATSRLLYRGPVAAPPPLGVQIEQTLDLAERVEGRLQDVMGVVRAQGLREDVLDARRLEDRSHRAARDDAGALDGRLQEDAPGAEVARDLARNRRVLERHEDQVLLRVLDGLSDRLRHFVRLSKAHAHVALGVLRGERAAHLRRGDVAAGTVLGPKRLAPAVDREERPTRVVVDELSVDVVEAPEHREARPRRGPAHVPPDPPMSEVARH